MSAVFAVPNTLTGSQAIKIGTPDGRIIRITVITEGGIIALANDPTSLNTPPTFSGIGGQIITQAGGQVQEVWEGELWAIGVAFKQLDPPAVLFVDFDIGSYPLNP
jgi:hypothetical protein